MAKTKEKEQDSEAASPAEVVGAYFDALAEKDLDAIPPLWERGAPDNFVGVAELRAPEEIQAFFGEIMAAIPDFRLEVLETVAEGERVAVRWRMTGTFDGPGRFQGFAPTGASLDLTGFDLLTVRDGLIRSNHAYANGTQIAQQIGAMPPAGSAGERLMTSAVNARTAAAQAIARLRQR